MAKLELQFTADGSEAVKAAQATKQQIVKEFVDAGQEVSAQKIAPDFDTVFRQLTQFRIGLTQLGRGDLGGIPNIIKGISLAGTQIEETTPKVAKFSDTIRLLDTALKQSELSTTGKDVFAKFQSALLLASNTTSEEGKKIRAEFKSLGVDVENALLKPDAAFKKFLTNFSRPTAQQDFSIQKIFGLGTNDSFQQLSIGIEKGGKAVRDFEAAETAAAAGATTLTGGLSIMTIGIAAAAAAAVGAGIALVAMANKAAESATAIGKLQDETGLSIDTLEKYQLTAKLLGTTTDTLAKSFVTFRDSIIEVRAGNEDAAKSFEVFGIKAEEAAKNPQKAYENLVVQISSMRDEGAKADAAQRLLGLSLGQLAEVTRIVTQRNGELTADVKRLSGTLSGEAVKSAQEYTKEVGLLSAEWDKFSTTIGLAVLPKISKIIEAANQFIALGGQFTWVGTVLVPSFGKVEQSTKNTAQNLADFNREGAISAVNFLKQKDKESKAVDDLSKRYLAFLKDQEKGTPKADTASAAALREEERKLRTIEENYRLQTAAAKREYDLRLKDEDDFVKKEETLAKDRLDKLSKNFDAQEKIVKNSSFNPVKTTEELTRITELRTRAQTEYNAALQKISDDSALRKREADKRYDAANFALLQERNKATIELTKDLLNAQALTEEEGQVRISAILQRELEKRIELANKEVAATGENSNERRIAIANRDALEAQLTELVRKGVVDRKAARDKDVANERAAAIELSKIYASAKQARIDLQATFAGNLQSVIQQNADAQIKLIDQQREREKQAAKEKLALLALASLTETADLEAITAKRAEILNQEKALEQEAADQRALIRRKALVDTENADPLGTRNVVGNAAADAVDAISNKLSTMQTLIQSIRAGFKATVQGMANDAQTPLKTIGALVGQMGANFLLSGLAAISAGRGIGNALRSMAQATAAQVAQIAGVKVIQNIAQGVEWSAAATALAPIDPAGAAFYAAAAGQAFQAAAIWGTIAIGSAIGAGALSGGGSSGGTSSLGTSLNSTRQDQNTVSTDNRFRYYEAGRMVTEIHIVTDTDMQLKSYQTNVVKDFAQGGPTRKVIRSQTHGEPIF